MKYCLALILSIFTAASINAQSRVDSLKTRYQKALADRDEENAAYYAALIANDMTRASQYDSAIRYYQKSLTLSDRPAFIASTFNGLGVVYNYKGYPDSCIRYYKEAFERYKLLGDSTNIATIEGNLAIVYKNLGWYDEALEAALGALTILERQPPDRTLGSVCSTIGSVYLLTGDIARSIHYHRRSLKVRLDLSHALGVGQSLTNLGEAYTELKNYDSALSYFLRAAEIKRKFNSKSELASTLKQIGRVYLLTRNTKEAEQPLLEAAAIKREVGERASEADIINSIGHLRMMQNRPKEARELLHKANHMLRESFDMTNLSHNLELQIELEKSTGNAQVALAYAEELGKVKDSLLNVGKAEVILSMETRYESEKKAKQILALENDRLILDASVRSRETSIFFLAGVILISIIFGVVLYRKNQSLREARDLNAHFLKEVNHRVKNNLQIISTLFRIPYQDIEDTNALRLIKSGESRVNAMALIHRQLSEKTSYRTITLDSFLGELAHYLDQSFGFTNGGGDLKITCPAITVDIDSAIPLSLVINELIGNSMKHSRATHINVQISKSGNGIGIEVSDNGIGSKSDQPQTPGGFGLRLISMMVKELHGTMAISTSNGFHTHINIPSI